MGFLYNTSLSYFAITYKYEYNVVNVNVKYYL